MEQALWMMTGVGPSGVGMLGTVAVEDLLILQRDMRDKRRKEKKKCTSCCTNVDL